jgi:hypothetical protein
VLQLFELGEIDHAGHLIGSEHPLHGRFQEFNGDLSSEPPPDKISRELLDSLPVLLRVSIRVLLGFFS